MKVEFYQVLTIVRRAIGYGVLAVFLTFIIVIVFALQQRPDLSLWHQVRLHEEFEADSGINNFASYLTKEGKLFAEMDREIYQKSPVVNSADASINRYQRGSRTDPTSQVVNWNRTFVLKNENPVAGVLLLHGLSDSPYSLKNLGENLHQQGAAVIGLRIPGHGTIPSGLIDVSWQDMAAAVRLAMIEISKMAPGKSIFMIGYSNGGALAVQYALDVLDEPKLTMPDGLILISPEIALPRVAAIAVWQGRLGSWLGMEKIAWNSISLEYDPYKYSSFAINAGDQAYRLTQHNDRRLAKLEGTDLLKRFPRTIAFQSAVDATVSAAHLVTRLFNRLPPNGHELVVFDLNRRAELEHLIAWKRRHPFDELLECSDKSFDLTVLSNSKESVKLSIRQRRAAGGYQEIPTAMEWPDDVYSLSHVALPFAMSDPWYGRGENGQLTLGNLALRGERGVLRISPQDQLRQRWNPFYPWTQEKMFQFMRLKSDEGSN